MSADWRRLTREAGLRVAEDAVDVAFGDQRRQAVFVDASGADALRVWSRVAGPAAVARLRAPLLAAWRRNRLSELVGFSIDARGRLIGEAWVPTVGLAADEWAVYVTAVATACDRFEYLLTGRDEA